MTYLAQELSEYGAQPIELYEFTYGSYTYRYTSSDQNITYNLNEYEAVPIKRDNIERNQDIDRINLNIQISKEIDITDLFIAAPPSTIMNVTLRRLHYTDSSEEAVILWVGRIVNIKYNEGYVDFRCESIQTSIKRPALRRFYQSNCPHILYGDDCTLDSDTYKVTCTVDSYSGIEIVSSTFSTYDDGYFKGGYVSFYNTYFYETRFIIDHTGDIITINLQWPNLSSSDSIDVYPGCDHTLSTCENKFNNLNNYGGFPYHPDLNPFGTTLIM
jgi:uncharacterized phage protein (TIGR02218 family)